jgi:hypothetical protein
MLVVQCSPHSIGGFADTIPLDQSPCHGREHVIVFADVLQSLAGKLALHGERHEKFPSHQA